MRALQMTLVLFLCCVGCSVQAHAGQCEDSVASLEKVKSDHSLSDFQSRYEQVSTSCPSAQYPKVAFCAGRSAALSIYEDAITKQKNGQDGSKVELRLNEGLTLGRPWQLLNALGETASANRSYAAAAKYFQMAMNELNLPALPCPSEEATLREWSKADLKKMLTNLTHAVEAQLLLSDNFEKPPGDRSGNPGGIFLPSMRGISIEERSLPVAFEFNSAEFTAKGQDAFAALVDYVKRKNFKSIMLTGHTDSIGKAAYNCELASRRLKAITDALYIEIPDIKITAIPVGEFEPFEADSETGLSSDQINQLNRRVKLIETGVPPPKVCK